MIMKLIVAQERQYRGKGDWYRLVLGSVDMGRQCQRDGKSIPKDRKKPGYGIFLRVEEKGQLGVPICREVGQCEEFGDRRHW